MSAARVWLYRDDFHYLKVAGVLPKRPIREYTEYVRADTVEDAFNYKSALSELVRLQSEHHALNGGGPGWKDRWAKALAEAEELVRVEP